MKSEDLSELCLLKSHADAVLELPPEAVRLASSNATENEIFLLGERVLGM